jgi:hypothetical protein
MYRCNRPWSDGTTGMKLSPLERLEKLAALVPVPRAHLVRYGGCLAPHSGLRVTLVPSPRQQGMDGEETQTGAPYWLWARLLGRVFDLDMAACPLCRRVGSFPVHDDPRRIFLRHVHTPCFLSLRTCIENKGLHWPNTVLQKVS